MSAAAPSAASTASAAPAAKSKAPGVRFRSSSPSPSAARGLVATGTCDICSKPAPTAPIGAPHPGVEGAAIYSACAPCKQQFKTDDAQLAEIHRQEEAFEQNRKASQLPSAMEPRGLCECGDPTFVVSVGGAPLAVCRRGCSIPGDKSAFPGAQEAKCLDRAYRIATATRQAAPEKKRKLPPKGALEQGEAEDEDEGDDDDDDDDDEEEGEGESEGDEDEQGEEDKFCFLCGDGFHSADDRIDKWDCSALKFVRGRDVFICDTCYGSHASTEEVSASIKEKWMGDASNN